MVLDSLQVATFNHGVRNLRDHLVGTGAVLAAWNEPESIVALGLFHSIYSTPVYRHQAATAESRPLLANLLGEALESSIFTFSMLRMDEVAEGLKDSTAGVILCRPRPTKDRMGVSPAEVFLPREQAEDFLLVHVANLVEQDQAPSGAPGVHLARCAEISALLEKRAPYLRECAVGVLSLHQEMHLRDLYQQALSISSTQPLLALEILGEAALLAPFLAELRAAQAALNDDATTRASLSEEVKSLFARRGTTWDKRLTMTEWIAVSERRLPLSEKPHRQGYTGEEAALPPRFYQYMSRISREGPGKSNSGWYPGLASSPTHDPKRIPLCSTLETNFPQIVEEVQSLSQEDFHSEAEPIRRTGRWEVLLLFEAGKKNSKVCEQLPLLTKLLESSADVRTSAGLVYLSRLRPHTHVSAHRGGTNSRLRLHLGITIPDGDCGMRVDDQHLRWEPGKTILFDDFYEHEVWNNTDEERLILLVDLWHFDLTPQERICLDAISKQVAGEAMSRSRYWEANQRQRRQEARDRSLLASTRDPHQELLLSSQ